ncbi:RnfABCDGE type electron transport complex subunit C [Candidatus Xianfuyuplasma coldseepsis]|uniref:Ion-translocating oxidoreductase complex subunit C n=1 Tax=Candidatus Xianfuyuplasma coldseepsis TaxID=2782163 RepID=A0A7L7KQQ5_9MOLU|nr:RnfABCDGE type electron transport complex subunit C [Xianfuyuplasma coldseepsis]QMS84284.1 RnfABCDGE type electron transport complex subunit C [Xianfuyuplasma coldseepsis]
MIKKSRKVRDYKELTKALPTMRFLEPESVYIHLQNGRCKTYDLYVKEGDYVKLGEVIGIRHGGFFEQPIHATVSGTVGTVSKKLHRTGRKVDCVEIRNDFKETYHESIVDRTDQAIAELTQDDMVQILKEKSLVGLGGSGFPSYIKLATKEKIDTVVINAVECEPYLSSDYRLILEHPRRVIAGMTYIMQALHVKTGIIAIKKSKDPLYQVLTQVIKGKFPEYDIQVVKLGDYYPQGWEIEVFRNALGIDVPHGELPMKYGVIGFNVSTAAGVYDAIKHNLPVTKRYFTLTGDAIKYPQNYRVKVGTSVKKLIELSDGFKEDYDKVNIIMGGPMMGVSTVSCDVIVSKTTTSVIVLQDTDYEEQPCVRCGSCVYSCPAHLEPVQIMNAVKRNDKDVMKGLGAYKCIECGLCAYVCTSKIHVTDYVRKAKRLIG